MMGRPAEDHPRSLAMCGLLLFLIGELKENEVSFTIDHWVKSVGNRRAIYGKNRRVSSEGQAGMNTPTFCNRQKSQDRGLKYGILATSIKPDPNLQIENKALEMG